MRRLGLGGADDVHYHCTAKELPFCIYLAGFIRRTCLRAGRGWRWWEQLQFRDTDWLSTVRWGRNCERTGRGICIILEFPNGRLATDLPVLWSWGLHCEANEFKNPKASTACRVGLNAKIADSRGDDIEQSLRRVDSSSTGIYMSAWLLSCCACESDVDSVKKLTRYSVRWQFSFCRRGISAGWLESV